MRFPNKIPGWLALAGVLLLVGVLIVSRSRDAGSPGSSGSSMAEEDRVAAVARLQKAGREPVGAKRNRSLSETFGPLDETIERKLTATQIHAFVSERNRSVDALLSAFRLGGGKAYLEEALERFPDHPQVIFASLSEAHDPAKRLAVLEDLKRVDPGNALGYCLVARALFDLGKKDEALAEMQNSAGKPVNDFMISSAQNDEEAYLAAGFPPTKAKMAALFGSTKRELLQLRALGQSMGELRASYQSSGDQQSAEAVRDLQIGLGRQLQDSGTTVDVLVGMVVEKQGLAGLESEESQARLEEIRQRKEYLITTGERMMALMDDPSVAEGDWSIFFDRAKIFGEAAANEWMLEKYPGK